MLGFLSRFVDSNDRELHRIQPLVDRTNALESEMEARSEAELRAFVDELRDQIRDAGEPEEPSDDERHHPELERRRELAKARRQREHDRLQAAMDEALPEVFAATREAMRRTLKMRHFETSSSLAASSSTRAGSPRCGPARARRRRRRWLRR